MCNESQKPPEEVQASSWSNTLWETLFSKHFVTTSSVIFQRYHKLSIVNNFHNVLILYSKKAEFAKMGRIINVTFNRANSLSIFYKMISMELRLLILYYKVWLMNVYNTEIDWLRMVNERVCLNAQANSKVIATRQSREMVTNW